MNQLRKRLENLEAAIAPPAGRPFCIWGTVGDYTTDMRRKTEEEIQFEIASALASGAMAAIDRPVVVSWKDPQMAMS